MCYSRARLPLITGLTPQALECGRCARRSGAPRTRLRCPSVLVDQSAEQILSAYGGRGAGVVDRRGTPAVWRDESERAVRPMLVVMAGVHAQYSSEMSASEDEDAIETVATDRAHPALSDRIRVWRLDRRPDHFDPLGAEDFVEDAAELLVAVVDQQLEAGLRLAQLH